MRSLTVIAAVSFVLLGAALRADAATPQEFQWNVFLPDWQLLGPFPKEADDETGLVAEYVQNEATLSAGQVSFYKNQLYTWKHFADRVIDFRKELGVNGSKGENKVAYAWTQFVSPVAQNVQMGVAYDDAFVAWLNGKEVARGTDNWASLLDQEVVDVDLKAGINTLLLRVSNGRTKWDAAVRFLPADLEQPLLTFKATPANNNARLPVVDVTLLDANKKVISEHQCSGSRKAYPGIPGYYALYAELPDPAPAFVRLSVRQPHFQKTETIGSWERVHRGNFVARLLSDPPAELLVIDKLTRKPIADAQCWSAQTMAEETTGPDGKVVLPDVTPMSDRLYVVAKGYEAATVNLKWPRGAIQRVELVEGGRTLTGTIVSTSGERIPGAQVNSGLSSSGYAPSVTADGRGQFEMYGLPKDRATLYPVIEADGFVTKGRFSFQLTSDDMSVNWELTPGVSVIGQVVHQETGEPLPDIRITVGDDRFGGSNDKSPTTTTDAKGFYRLTGVAEGENLLHAFSDDYSPAMKTVTTSFGTETRADFTLNEGKPVTGTITDPDGKPLAGVWLVTDTWNGARMFQREDRTDGKGRFTLPHMPDSAAEVDILKSGFISNRNFRMRGGDTFELIMHPAITHTITVRDAASGKIVPQLQIAKGYLWEGNRDWSWRSDEWETTRYYDRLKGVMKIEIDEPFNYQVAYRFRATGFKEQIVNLPDKITVGKEFKVELQPATVFAGRVVDAESGQPLPGIAVAIVSPEDQMRPDYYVDYTTPWRFLDMKKFTGQHTVTDAMGTFRLSPPSSRSSLSIALLSEQGGFHLVTNLDDVLTSIQSDSDPLELPFPRQGSVEGRATIAGQPLANTKVRLSWSGYDETTNRGNQSFGFGGQVTTDADGVFRYENVGPGRYQISRVFNFTIGGGASMSTYIDTQELVLLPGQSLTHNLAQPAGVSLSGVVRDAAENPVSDAIVKVNVSGDNSRQLAATTSSVEGRFEIEHLAPGSYLVSADHYARSERGFFEQDLRGSTTVELTTAKDDVTIEMGDVNRQSSSTQVGVSIAGTLSPDFTVTPLDSDTPFTLSDRFGKVAVVCFWASWSGDATAIAGAYEKFKDNPDVEFITVIIQDEEQFRGFEKQSGTEFEFPVVTTEANASGQLASVFGITGQSGCFVIGRDGRFAAEQTPSSQLAAAIDRTLSQTLPDELSTANPSKLTITLSADGSVRGVYGASVDLKARTADGKTIREDHYSLNGVTRQMTWRYPSLPKGGRLEVTVRGKGIQPRTQTLNAPSAEETLVVDVESPRLISGKIRTLTDEKPVAGMQVKFQMYGGEIFLVESDANGEFSARCFPGSYYITVVGNDEFTAEASSVRTLTVALDADPKPIEIKAVPAVTLRGVVVDQAGKPVVGAIITAQSGTTATSDAEGGFSLAGVASVGDTQVWAMSGDVYGAIRFSDPNVEKAYTITLGEGLNSTEPSVSSLTVGSKVSEFEVLTLNGEKTKWQPVAEADRLLVFCELWHPASKQFLEKARAWAGENSTPIELISLDWNIDQARREAGSLKLSERTLFAGPGLLNLDAQWRLSGGRGAFLVGHDGKLASMPLD